MADEKLDHPGVRLPPPVVLLGAILLGLGLDALWPAPLSAMGLALPRALSIGLGALILLAGFGIALACFFQFKAAGTAIEPWKPSDALIGGGLYRRSRNPIYLGMLLVIIGVAFLANSLWHLALLLPVWAFLRFAVIAREERYLEDRFGEDYRRYRSSVRRWL